MRDLYESLTGVTSNGAMNRNLTLLRDERLITLEDPEEGDRSMIVAIAPRGEMFARNIVEPFEGKEK